MGMGDHLVIGLSRVSGLQIAVETSNVELQLGADESYEMVVEGSGGVNVLTAVTVWGALRGLETFSQLIHFDEDAEFSISVSLAFSLAFSLSPCGRSHLSCVHPC